MSASAACFGVVNEVCPGCDVAAAAWFDCGAAGARAVKAQDRATTWAEWPLPIPIVEKEGKWYFDTKAGLKEILFRRIGTNELDAITICRGYVEAQIDYAEEIHDNSGVNQYAQRIISTPGNMMGWPGKTRMVLGEVRLERPWRRPLLKATGKRANPSTATISRY
jgi:hypothetical protein